MKVSDLINTLQGLNQDGEIGIIIEGSVCEADDPFTYLDIDVTQNIGKIDKKYAEHGYKDEEEPRVFYTIGGK